jgi:hypothetical protein
MRCGIRGEFDSASPFQWSDIGLDRRLKAPLWGSPPDFAGLLLQKRMLPGLSPGLPSTKRSYRHARDLSTFCDDMLYLRDLVSIAG